MCFCIIWFSCYKCPVPLRQKKADGLKFEWQLSWKRMTNKEGENYLALTGPLPDLISWSAVVPGPLSTAVKQWKPCGTFSWKPALGFVINLMWLKTFPCQSKLQSHPLVLLLESCSMWHKESCVFWAFIQRLCCSPISTTFLPLQQVLKMGVSVDLFISTRD